MIAWVCRLADSVRHRARLRRWSPDQAAGRHGEDLAHRRLERQGFIVIARNYRPPGGDCEIDLVAWEGGTLVFVEVKSRRSDEYAAPDRNIGEDKRRALIRAARGYARRAEVPWERVRFDVVSVVLAAPPVFTHVRDAFRVTPTL